LVTREKKTQGKKNKEKLRPNKRHSCSIN